MDSTEILALVFNPEGEQTHVGMFYALLQQGVAQLAAIRELLEAEPEQLARERGPWPPAQSEPHSHVG